MTSATVTRESKKVLPSPWSASHLCTNVHKWVGPAFNIPEIFKFSKHNLWMSSKTYTLYWQTFYLIWNAAARHTHWLTLAHLVYRKMT